MPWVAIPFSDSDTRNHLDELFHVKGIPHLALLDEAGKIVTEDGVEVIREYGVEGYPFTSERIQELKDQEEEAKRNQSLRSLLVSQSRDFVISSGGKKIPISELEGKTVGLYFYAGSFGPCSDFTEQLKGIYEKLKEKGENFEVVVIPFTFSPAIEISTTSNAETTTNSKTTEYGVVGAVAKWWVCLSTEANQPNGSN